MHAPFWLTTALLFPVLLYQGKRTRRVTPRLPEATGDCAGQYGEGEPLFRLLVLGESTAAGVVDSGNLLILLVKLRFVRAEIFGVIRMCVIRTGSYN